MWLCYSKKFTCDMLCETAVSSRGRMVRLGGWEDWSGVAVLASDPSTSGVTTIVAALVSIYVYLYTYTVKMVPNCLKI